MPLYIYDRAHTRDDTGEAMLDWLATNCRGPYAVRRKPPNFPYSVRRARRLRKHRRGWPFIVQVRRDHPKARWWTKRREFRKADPEGFVTRYKRRLRPLRAPPALVIVFDDPVDLIHCKLRWH